MKYEFAVDGITFKDFLALSKDENANDGVGMSTLEIGKRSGAHPVWEDGQFCISGDDEHMLICYACMCHCVLGHEEYYPVMLDLLAMTPAA